MPSFLFPCSHTVDMLRLQKQLSSNVFRCGKSGWMPMKPMKSTVPTLSAHSEAGQRWAEHWKPVTVHSWAQCQKNTLTYRKSRHMGIGM